MAGMSRRKCLSCTGFLVGLGASGEIEAEERCGKFYVFSFSMRRAAQFCMCRRIYIYIYMDRGNRQTGKERNAVVEA